MLKTDANPEGLPIEVFDEIRDRTLADNSQYWLDLAEVFYSANTAATSPTGPSWTSGARA
jgi:non-heme chloroperoxidase